MCGDGEGVEGEGGEGGGGEESEEGSMKTHGNPGRELRGGCNGDCVRFAS